jgi:hypothetical protein
MKSWCKRMSCNSKVWNNKVFIKLNINYLFCSKFNDLYSPPKCVPEIWWSLLLSEFCCVLWRFLSQRFYLKHKNIICKKIWVWVGVQILLILSMPALRFEQNLNINIKVWILLMCGTYVRDLYCAVNTGLWSVISN